MLDYQSLPMMFTRFFRADVDIDASPSEAPGIAIRLLNALAPTQRTLKQADISYGRHPRQKYDLYCPLKTGAPLVIFFSGGSWQEGHRAFYHFIGSHLASRGIMVAIPDYRVFPDVLYPDFLSDCAYAVAAIAADQSASSVILMGHSAGAYNAAMLAVDPTLRQGLSLPFPSLAGMIGLAGPYDFLPLVDPILQTIFGPQESWPATQPVNRVRRDAVPPPMLLLTGGGDETVWPRNSDHLATAVRAVGGLAERGHYPGLGHKLLVGALGWPFSMGLPVLKDIERFIAKVGSSP